MDKVLLAVYGVQIYRKSDSQIPSNFGGNVDFLTLFHEFTDYVLKNVQKWERPKETNLALTCPTLPVLDTKGREVRGFFNAGRDGERFDIQNLNVKGVAPVRVTRDLHSIRGAFFYLHVPIGQRKAYLVLQRAHSQGIKELVMHCFNDFMALKGLNDYRVILYNLINDKVFVDMMSKGRFKELTLTKLGIPKNIDDLRGKSEKPIVEKGSIKTIYQAYDLGDTWKEWILNKVGATRQSKQNPSEKVVVEINGAPESYDEVSVLVELNGKQKTFRLANTSRTQPDMDVTDNVRLDDDGQLLLGDLLTQARELVDSVKLDVNRDDIAS